MKNKALRKSLQVPKMLPDGQGLGAKPNPL